MVKSLPVMQETQVQILSWDDPLEKGMDTLQYSCLENSRDRERSLVGYSPRGHKVLDRTEQIHKHS